MSISYEDTEEKNKDGFMEAQMFPHAEFSWCKAAFKNGTAPSKIFAGQRNVQSESSRWFLVASADVRSPDQVVKLGLLVYDIWFFLYMDAMVPSSPQSS